MYLCKQWVEEKPTSMDEERRDLTDALFQVMILSFKLLGYVTFSATKSKANVKRKPGL